jgi:hypothetical protein
MNLRSIQTGLLTFQSNQSTDKRKRDLDEALRSQVYIHSQNELSGYGSVSSQSKMQRSKSNGTPEFTRKVCQRIWGSARPERAVIPPVSFVCLSQPNDFGTANEILFQPSSKSSLSVRRIFQFESLRTIFDERQFHLSPRSHTLGSPQGKLFGSSIDLSDLHLSHLFVKRCCPLCVTSPNSVRQTVNS